MNPKEIGRAASRTFAAALPPHWILRDQEDQEDFGVDAELEVAEPGGQASGTIFKVQIKGALTAEYDDAGSLVYSRAEVGKFSYYVERLKIPILFVVCDLATSRCFWVKVQGNTPLEDALRAAVGNHQKTFSISLPSDQRFENTEAALARVMKAFEDSQRVIDLRQVNAIPAASVCESLRAAGSASEIEAKLRFMAGMAAHQAIHDMIAAGDFKGAAAKAKAVFESPVENVEARIHAGMAFARALERLFNSRERQGASVEAARIRLVVAGDMIALARRPGCPGIAKKYARIYLRSSRMHLNAIRALGLSKSQLATQMHGETLSGPFVSLQRTEMQAMVTRDFVALLRTIPRLAKGAAPLIPFALGEAIEGILSSLGYLRAVGQLDLVKSYANAAAGWVPMALQVLDNLAEDEMRRETMNLGLRFVSIGSLGLLDHTGVLENFTQAVERLPPRPGRAAALEAVRQFCAGLKYDAGSAEPTWDEIRDYFTRAAAELGINLNDPNDWSAQMVRVGLEDLDPRRVLRNCSHMHVAYPYRGIVAEMLGMPTAGIKRVVCLKHGHFAQQLHLDDAYRFFAKNPFRSEGEVCCETCPNKAPHPDGWDMSKAWEDAQHARYMELRARMPPGGV